MTLERLSTHTAALSALEPIVAQGDLLDLPSVLDGGRYSRAYWGGTIRNLLVPHRLQAGNVEPCAAGVTLTPGFRARWAELYGPCDGDVPYLVTQSTGTLLYLRLFAQLGINLKNLLHVQHQTTHYVPVPEWATADRQELHCSLRGAWRLTDGKALFALRTAMHYPRDLGGALIGTSNDRFIVRNVPAADFAALASGKPMMRSILALRRKEPQLDRSAPGTRIAEIPLSMDMGLRFGRVSGEYSPWHTTPLAAKVFGFKRPFLQGLGVRNALVRQFVLAGIPLTRFQMSFTTKAYLGQTLTLVMQENLFELVDERGIVVSFGSTNEQT